RATLEVRGRGSWTDADLFHETVLGLLDAGRPVEVALSRCEHLDSTFLGTLHELVTRANDGKRPPLRLGEAPSPVRHGLEELGMERVLEAASTQRRQGGGDLRPLAGTGRTGPGSQRRILQAHETLASLSPENRERFQTVLDALRGEVGTDGDH